MHLAVAHPLGGLGIEKVAIDTQMYEGHMHIPKILYNMQYIYTQAHTLRPVFQDCSWLQLHCISYLEHILMQKDILKRQIK